MTLDHFINSIYIFCRLAGNANRARFRVAYFLAAFLVVCKRSRKTGCIARWCRDRTTSFFASRWPWRLGFRLFIPAMALSFFLLRETISKKGVERSSTANLPPNVHSSTESSSVVSLSTFQRSLNSSWFFHCFLKIPNYLR